MKRRHRGWATLRPSSRVRENQENPLDIWGLENWGGLQEEAASHMSPLLRELWDGTWLDLCPHAKWPYRALWVSQESRALSKNTRKFLWAQKGHRNDQGYHWAWRQTVEKRETENNLCGLDAEGHSRPENVSSGDTQVEVKTQDQKPGRCQQKFAKRQATPNPGDPVP